MKKNPPGEWEKLPPEGRSIFKNDDIGVVYGLVYPDLDRWYWEARTNLDTRLPVPSLPRGYVFSEENAKKIVELILYASNTVKRKKLK